MHACLFWLVTPLLLLHHCLQCLQKMRMMEGQWKEAFPGMLARWMREISKSSQLRTKGVFHSRRLQCWVYFSHEFSATWRRGAAHIHLIHQPTQWRRHKSRRKQKDGGLSKTSCGAVQERAELSKKYCAHSPPQRGIQAPWILFYYRSICLPFYYSLSVNFSSACCCRISYKNSPPTLPLWVDLFSPLTKQETKRRHLYRILFLRSQNRNRVFVGPRWSQSTRGVLTAHSAPWQGKQEMGAGTVGGHAIPKTRWPQGGWTRSRPSQETHCCVEFHTRSALSFAGPQDTHSHTVFFLGLRQTSWWQNVDFSL